MQQQATKSRIIKQLKRELQRSTARKIWYIRGKVKSGSTTLVSVEQPGGGTIDYIDKQDIEREILRSNKHKFKQSHHHPSYHNPLKNCSSGKAPHISPIWYSPGLTFPLVTFQGKRRHYYWHCKGLITSISYLTAK